jgi:CheY-like chemotaxis protein
VLTGTRILLIDSHKASRQPLSARLAAEGFAVTAVASGEEGLQEAVKHRVDLVLLDMALPERSGVQTYQELRASRATRSLPVILLAPDVAEDRWDTLPYEAEGRTFLMGRAKDPTLLLARVSQLLTVTR